MVNARLKLLGLSYEKWIIVTCFVVGASNLFFLHRYPDDVYGFADYIASLNKGEVSKEIVTAFFPTLKDGGGAVVPTSKVDPAVIDPALATLESLTKGLTKGNSLDPNYEMYANPKTVLIILTDDRTKWIRIERDPSTEKIFQIKHTMKNPYTVVFSYKGKENKGINYIYLVKPEVLSDSVVIPSSVLNVPAQVSVLKGGTKVFRGVPK